MYTKIIGITGSTGFIGSNLLKELSKAHKVIVINLRDYADFDQLIYDLNKYKLTHFLNCVGGKSVGTSKLYPVEDFKSNVESPTKILYALSKCKNKIHFTHISSAGVYGEQSISNIYSFTFSPYANHKKIYDDLLISTTTENVDYLIVRPFSVYGPGLKKQLIWDSYRKFTSEETPIFFGTGNELRNFIYIDDLCSIIRLHIEKDSTGIIDVGSDEVQTIKEVLEIFVNVLGFNLDIKFNNIKDKGNPINLSEIQHKLKVPFNKYTSLLSGLKKYADWIK